MTTHRVCARVRACEVSLVQGLEQSHHLLFISLQPKTDSLRAGNACVLSLGPTTRSGTWYLTERLLIDLIDLYLEICRPFDFNQRVMLF